MQFVKKVIFKYINKFAIQKRIPMRNKWTQLRKKNGIALGDI